MISDREKEKIRANHESILSQKRAIKALHKDVGFKAYNALYINANVISTQVDIMLKNMTPLTSYHLLEAAGENGEKLASLIKYNRKLNNQILENVKTRIPRHIPSGVKWAFEEFENARGYTTDNIYKVGPVLDFDTKKPHYIRWPSDRLANTIELSELGGWHKQGSAMRVVAAEKISEVPELGTTAYRVARYNSKNKYTEISYIARYPYTDSRGGAKTRHLNAETKLERSLVKRMSTVAAHRLRDEIRDSFSASGRLSMICNAIGRGTNSTTLHEKFHYSELEDVLRLLNTKVEVDSYQWHTGIAVLNANIIPEDV